MKEGRVQGRAGFCAVWLDLSARMIRQARSAGVLQNPVPRVQSGGSSTVISSDEGSTRMTACAWPVRESSLYEQLIRNVCVCVRAAFGPPLAFPHIRRCNCSDRSASRLAGRRGRGQPIRPATQT